MDYREKNKKLKQKNEIYKYFYDIQNEIEIVPNYLEYYPLLTIENRTHILKYLYEKDIFMYIDGYCLFVQLLDKYMSMNRDYKYKPDDYYFIALNCVYLAYKLTEGYASYFNMQKVITICKNLFDSSNKCSNSTLTSSEEKILLKLEKYEYPTVSTFIYYLNDSLDMTPKLNKIIYEHLLDKKNIGTSPVYIAISCLSEYSNNYTNSFPTKNLPECIKSTDMYRKIKNKKNMHSFIFINSNYVEIPIFNKDEITTFDDFIFVVKMTYFWKIDLDENDKLFTLIKNFCEKNTPKCKVFLKSLNDKILVVNKLLLFVNTLS